MAVIVSCSEPSLYVPPRYFIYKSQLPSKTPILSLSALNDKEIIAKSYAEGATDYAAKPIRNEMLRDKIGALLGSC